jgi:hypothetical protein
MKLITLKHLFKIHSRKPQANKNENNAIWFKIGECLQRYVTGLRHGVTSPGNFQREISFVLVSLCINPGA